MVLGIAAKTPMASPDHWQATQITDAAVFYSRLCKWDEHFTDPELGPLPVHRIDKQVWYPLGFSTTALPPHGGSFVADVTSSYEKKLAAVRCYKSQFPPEKKRVWDILEGASRFHGAAAGFERGELFLSLTTTGLHRFSPNGSPCGHAGPRLKTAVVRFDFGRAGKAGHRSCASRGLRP